MYLTEHFDSDEFNCSCECGFGFIKPDLVYLLEMVRKEIKKPMKINSGVVLNIIGVSVALILPLISSVSLPTLVVLV